MKSMMSGKVFLFLCISLLVACGGGGGGGSDDGDDDDSSVSGANPCGTVVDIGPNSIINGMLEAGDCRVTDFDPTSGDASFADEYRVTLTSMGTLIITMRSADLDSFLVLLNRSSSCSNGCTDTEAMVITADDDSGGGTDALIQIEIEQAGSYVITASGSRAISESGCGKRMTKIN